MLFARVRFLQRYRALIDFQPDILAASLTESFSQHHPDALPIGTVLGDFAITGLIGEGGFGIVYLAYEATLDRVVAIKEYLPVMIAARTAEQTVAVRSHGNREAYVAGLQSFLREARLQASFSHHAMLEVYRVWEENGTAYMAMRYYPGETLRKLRSAESSSSAFDETAVQRIMMPVFDALVELHSQSVLHRDVSPDNILIMPTGQPVLLDFGAARTVVTGAVQSLTTVLKPGYAPIEQYADDGTMEQGPWTDVYGLGAVLYFLAMGVPPPQAVARLMGDSLRGFEEAASASYSPTFIDAVKRALNVRPEGRLQSVDALREALGWSWGRTSAPSPATIIAVSELMLQADDSRHESIKNAVISAPVEPSLVEAVAATPSRSKWVSQLFIGVAVAGVAVTVSIFVLKRGVSIHPADSTGQKSSAAMPLVAPSSSSNTGRLPVTSAPPLIALPAAPSLTTRAPAAPTNATTLSPQPSKPSSNAGRFAGQAMDTVELGESIFDADVTPGPRGAGRTSSDVCERLLAKFSLGAEELSSSERRRLSGCQ